MCLHYIYPLHILKDVSDFFIHLSCMHLSRSVQHTWVVSIYIFIVHVCHFESYICFFSLVCSQGLLSTSDNIFALSIFV